MKFTSAILALAGAAAAAPAAAPADAAAPASCPALPASFQVSNFKFGGERGPVYLEAYNFNVKGNIGPSTASCSSANAGGSKKCQLAFRDVNSTQCPDSNFSWSFLGSDTAGFTFTVNYTLPNCPTVTGCRFFPASDIKCVADATRPSVRYENLIAPSSFTLPASTNSKCISH